MEKEISAYFSAVECLLVKGIIYIKGIAVDLLDRRDELSGKVITFYWPIVISRGFLRIYYKLLMPRGMYLLPLGIMLLHWVLESINYFFISLSLHTHR